MITGLGLLENWPWPWPLTVLALASKWSGLGLEHAVLEPIPDYTQEDNKDNYINKQCNSNCNFIQPKGV